ncbi:MAG: aldo/keto reductase, partial [Rhodospirillales bacterium]|nr:aldo/keto reductase [Rhodospirillales bacterium]
AKRGAGVKKYINPKGMAVLKALDDTAKKHNSNPTQVTLAWLMQRKSITAPIVSATSLKQLDDVLNSTTLEIDPESIAALDKASAAA